MKATEGKVTLDKERIRIITPVARATYVHLFEPDDYNDKKKYGLTLLFPPEADLGPMKKAAFDAAVRKFGENAVKGRLFGNPFRSGDDRAADGKGDYFEGTTVVAAKSVYAPEVYKKINGVTTQITDPQEVYWGMYVRAVVTVYLYENSGKKGISLPLVRVLKVRDGDPIGSMGISAEDEFADLEDSDISENGSDNGYWAAESGKSESFLDDDDDKDDMPF